MPNKFVKNYEVSQAAANFCFDLIDNDCFDKAISLIPINITDYIKDNCEYYKTEFIQCRFFPQNRFFRFLNNVIENLSIVKKSSKASTIWVYNITLSNILAVFILRFILFKKVYAIIADYMPPTNKFSGNYIINLCIKSLHGLITLSARGNAKNSNRECIAGIIPTTKIQKAHKMLNSRKFLFSGILNKVNGIDMAIDVFSKVPNAELIITGRDYEGVIDKIKPYGNITYLGFLAKEDYNKIFNEVTFCLNFRNPSYPENYNNFPSKILEYFSQNKAVISTIEYPELYSIHYFYSTFNTENIIELVNDLLNLSNDKLENHCNHTEQLKLNFSESKWKTMLLQIENNKKN